MGDTRRGQHVGTPSSGMVREVGEEAWPAWTRLRSAAAASGRQVGRSLPLAGMWLLRGGLRLVSRIGEKESEPCEGEINKTGGRTEAEGRGRRTYDG